RVLSGRALRALRGPRPSSLAAERPPSRVVPAPQQIARELAHCKTNERVEGLGRVIPNGELSAGERWYVARTLPNREAGAASQLEAQGFRVFLPRIARTVRHARKMRRVRAPAFPAYLFVALDLNRDRWRSVNGTFGLAETGYSPGA